MCMDKYCTYLHTLYYNITYVPEVLAIEYKLITEN